MDALLARYASGQLSRPVSVLMASHLEISPVNRSYVAGLEALGGAMMESLAPVPLANRDRKLAAIFALDDEPIKAPAAPVRRRAGCGVLPAALHDFVGSRVDELPWRTKLPGLKEYRVRGQGDCEASLMWIRAGRRLLSHTHEGSEITLVLQGGFSDTNGHYIRGDIAVADEAVDHQPIADDDGEDCIVFAVTDGSLRLTGPVGRVISRFMRR